MEHPPPGIRLLLLLLAVAMMSVGMLGCAEDAGSKNETVDSTEHYDADGDGYSNAVESNDANAYLGLHLYEWDQNTSIAHGKPCRSMCAPDSCCGWIEYGVNLPNSGTGYYHDRGSDMIDTDDWAVLFTIQAIERGGREWHRYDSTLPRIGILDISKGTPFWKTGGLWPPHSCHQNGLDVDIRYVRSDGLELRLDLAGSDSIFFNREVTEHLVTYLTGLSDVERIYIDYRTGIAEVGVIEHKAGHSDHMHVRFADPDGTSN